MNTVPIDRKIAVLTALVEGVSIRSVERMTHTHRDTICRILRTTGEQCEAFLSEKLRDIRTDEIEVDECWCYVAKKDSHLAPGDGPDKGSQYIFTALDAKSKLVLSYIVGKRDIATAHALMKDLSEKIVTRFQLTTDAFPGFKYAVSEAFGWHGIDYAQLTKVYFLNGQPRREGYTPSSFIRVYKKTIMGEPNMKKASTSYIERSHLTMRMQMRRFTRLTNAFSKKLENLKAAVNLYFAWYDFMRIHQTLKSTPAINAGITDHVWTMEEMLGL